jgi:hypothetical protein
MKLSGNPRANEYRRLRDKRDRAYRNYFSATTVRRSDKWLNAARHVGAKIKRLFPQWADL